MVGGHLESGETPEEALRREVEEETGWTVGEILATVADWEWEHEGRVRREVDYLVTVDGDLERPRLEVGKHDRSAWVGPGELELLMEGRTDGDRRLRDVVAHAVRTRMTERLRLEPVTGPGPVLTGHGPDLVRLFADPWVAQWYGGVWSTEVAEERAAEMGVAWERDGVSKWIAYERSTGLLAGRGGLSRLPAGSTVTTAVEALAGPEWGVDRLELGWALVESARGRGLATELGRAGLEFAFETLGARSVIAFTERHNQASRAVMERLGMASAGEITAEGWIAGVLGVQPEAPFAVYVART
ncbi:hypothetical protein GCM10009534_05220 [Kribbella sandramycini]